MVSRNPDCDNGLIDDDPADASAYAWSCGCGSAAGGFPSKSKAKEAQRLHRFPRAEDRLLRDQQVDQIAEMFDVPRDLLDGPPLQSLPDPAPQPRPTQVLGGPFQITFTAAPTPSQQVADTIAADPCGVLGHRPAYLARGGFACGRCQLPL